MNVAIRVPNIAYKFMVPKFLKNGPVSILIALSNRIGGRRMIKKI